MNADKQTLRIITGWLNELSRLVRHFEEKPSNDQIAIYATMLGHDLPSTAFSSASLHVVAGDMTKWPDYASLRKVLLAWWNEHKPAASPLLGYDNATLARLSKMDQSWLGFYHKRIQEGADRALLDSLIRQASPAAWNVLSPPKPQVPLSAGEVELIRATMATLTPKNPQPQRQPREPAILANDQLAKVREAARQQ